MNISNSSYFNSWKQQIEIFDYKKPIDLLRSIELNLSNVCNLKCSFCPHGNNWKIDFQQFMSFDVAKEIYRQLNNFDFNGFICIAGHGEPTLNPLIIQILELFKKFNISLITNGLTNVDWKSIAKFATVKVSLHNDLDLQKICQNLNGIDFILRNHTEHSSELIKNNRAGFFNTDNNNFKQKCCYYPFYEIFIDTNGKYRLCASQWSNCFQQSIFDTPIDEHFLIGLEKIKKTMALSKRISVKECKYCNSLGTIVGQPIFDKWKQLNSD